MQTGIRWLWITDVWCILVGNILTWLTITPVLWWTWILTGRSKRHCMEVVQCFPTVHLTCNLYPVMLLPLSESFRDITGWHVRDVLFCSTRQKRVKEPPVCCRRFLIATVPSLKKWKTGWSTGYGLNLSSLLHSMILIFWLPQNWIRMICGVSIW